MLVAHQNGFAGLAQVARFESDLPRPVFEQCLQPLLLCRRVLRMGDFRKVFPLQLLAGVAQQAREGRVNGGKPPIQARQRNPEVNLFKNRAEALFGNTQLLVKFAALKGQSGLRGNLIDQLAGYGADAIRLIGRHIQNPQHTRAGLQGNGVDASLLRAEPLTAWVLVDSRNVNRLPLPDRPGQKRGLLERNDTPSGPVPSSTRHR